MNTPELSAQSPDTPASIQHLTFRVRQAGYALPIELVREIIAHVEKDKDSFKRALEHKVEAFIRHAEPTMRAEER